MRRPTDALPQLTECEQKIIRALAVSTPRRDLAVRMHVSVNTIKTHTSSCYRKLGVTNRHDALREAQRRGYL